jgi:hypothetical protein
MDGEFKRWLNTEFKRLMNEKRVKRMNGGFKRWMHGKWNNRMDEYMDGCMMLQTFNLLAL